MDISEIKPVERFVEIVHPATGENIGIKVQLLSLKDNKVSSVKRRIQNRSIALEKRGKSFKAEDIEDNEIELLLACITGWDWGENKFQGEVPEFNEGNVKKVLKSLEWFKDQITEAIDDEKAFFQN